MRVLKLMVLAAVWLGILGYARASSSVNMVTGYLDNGSKQTLAAATDSDSCPVHRQANYFAARCADDGYRIMVADTCEVLCSSPVEP